ncbi:7720_t:CDS:1, partial [Funneliformis geosporum]
MTIEFKNKTGGLITVVLKDSSTKKYLLRIDIINGGIGNFDTHAGSFLAHITLNNRKHWETAVSDGNHYRVDGYIVTSHHEIQ